MRETRKAQTRVRRAWRQKMRRTTATTRAARVAAERAPRAARGKHPVPQEARNFVWCGDCRILMAYSWRKAIPHNLKTLPQKKATEKWYRAVRIRNLTKWSEAHSACTASRIGTRKCAANGGVSARRRMENKTPLTMSGAFCEVQNAAKTVFVRAWQRAAESLPGRVLPVPASPAWLLRPSPGRPDRRDARCLA